MQSVFASSVVNDLAVVDCEAACEVGPEITSWAYWAGACASATVWLAFLLYAIGRGFG
jgi:hypothetical protein